MPCALLLLQPLFRVHTNSTAFHSTAAVKQSIIDDPLMRNSAILIFANKQDLVIYCFFPTLADSPRIPRQGSALVPPPPPPSSSLAFLPYLPSIPTW